jgi:hypothetical protein
MPPAPAIASRSHGRDGRRDFRNAGRAPAPVAGNDSIDSDGDDAGWHERDVQPIGNDAGDEGPTEESAPSSVDDASNNVEQAPVSRRSTLAPTDPSPAHSADSDETTQWQSTNARQRVFGRPAAPPAPLDPLPYDVSQGTRDDSNVSSRGLETMERAPVRQSPRNVGDDWYVVQPNDNYWKISSKQYGSARYFMALEQYNDKTFPSGRTMRPGDRIQTPPATKLQEMYPDLIDKGAPQTSQSSHRRFGGCWRVRTGRRLPHAERPQNVSREVERHVVRHRQSRAGPRLALARDLRIEPRRDRGSESSQAGNSHSAAQRSPEL